MKDLGRSPKLWWASCVRAGVVRATFAAFVVGPIVALVSGAPAIPTLLSIVAYAAVFGFVIGNIVGLAFAGFHLAANHGRCKLIH
jgi:hypothetical protein